MIACSIGVLSAQIGINTESPQTLFHIDSKRDTNGNTNYADDVVITANGDIGIGVLSPSTKLEINTGGTATNVIKGFKLDDGSQGEKKILIREANSENVYWETSISFFKPLPAFSISNLNYAGALSTMYTGYSIVFPEPGIYWITIGMMITDNQALADKRYVAQFITSNNPADWGNQSMIFSGANEVYAHNSNGNPRVYYNQSLTVAAGQLTAYLMLRVLDSTNSGAISLYLGDNAFPACPQCTGGSYVRIA